MEIGHTNASKWLISCLFWISCLEQESTYGDEAKEESPTVMYDSRSSPSTL